MTCVRAEAVKNIKNAAAKTNNSPFPRYGSVSGKLLTKTFVKSTIPINNGTKIHFFTHRRNCRNEKNRDIMDDGSRYHDIICVQQSSLA